MHGCDDAQSVGVCEDVQSVAERSYPTSEVRGGSLKELSHVRGPGRRRRAPGWDSAGAAKRSYPCRRPGAVAARSGGRQELPHVQGAVAAGVPEGLEELFHVQGREGRR